MKHGRTLLPESKFKKQNFIFGTKHGMVQKMESHRRIPPYDKTIIMNNLTVAISCSCNLKTKPRFGVPSLPSQFSCLFTLAKLLEMTHEINDKKQIKIKTYILGYCYINVKRSRWEVRILLP